MNYHSEIIRLYNSDAYQKLSEYYGRRSMMDVLGIARREEVHSNFIAWVLNGKDLGCGDYAIRKFFQALVMAKKDFRCNADAYLPEELMDRFVTDAYDIVEISIDTEKTIPGEGEINSRRIDILLEVEVSFGGQRKILPVIIENKVKSREHICQTCAYYEWAQSEYSDRVRYETPLFVFLTPNKTMELCRGQGLACACEHYVCLNYQYLVDFVFEPLQACVTTEIGKHAIDDYLRCLSYANVVDEKGSKEELVMAITSKERELLRQFWKANQALLSAAMEALAEDEDSSEEERRAFRQASQTTSQRDYSKYRLEGENELYGKRGIVEAVVRKYLERNPNVTWEEFKEAFPSKLHAGGFAHVVSDETRARADRYFAPVRLADGTVFVYSNQWGIKNIEPFVEHARVLGYNLEKC